MANKKFSEFELKTTTSNVSHIVGYNGAENVRITPANFLDTTGGPYLPLAGGIMVGDTTHNDNVKSIYGTLGDGLEIYHNGTNSYIDDSGTGNLILRSSDLRIEKYTGEEIAKFVSDGAVSLYYDNSKKFETTSLGATVTGDLVVTGSITGVGGSYLPLAGGTLTGALTGTSATFAGTIIAGNSTAAVWARESSSKGQILGLNSIGITYNDLDIRSGSGTQLYLNTSGNVGIGTTNPSNKFVVAEGTDQNGVEIIPGTTSFLQAYDRATSSYGVLRIDALDLRFATNNGSEKMRLDASGDLGLGTSTLQNSLGFSSLSINGSTGGQIAFQTGGVSKQFLFSTSTDLSIYNGEAGSLKFFTSALQRMVINSAGDIEIGAVTGTAKLNVDSANEGDSYFQGGTGNARQLKFSTFATISPHAGHKINATSSNGEIALATGGTERIRLNSAGNLGIGTTSPLSLLSIQSDNATAYDSSVDDGQDGEGATIMAFNTDSTTTNSFSQLLFRNRSSGVAISRIVSLSVASGTTDLAFVTENSNVKAEKMRITGAGNVGIGTATPRAVGSNYTGLEINSASSGSSLWLSAIGDAANGYLAMASNGLGLTAITNHPLIFGTNNAEKMRITSGGNILIGKTADDDNSTGCRLANFGVLSASRSGNVAAIFNRTTNDGALVLFRKDGSQVGSISVTASATAYNTSSDYRLKEDLQDFEGLDLVSKIPVYDYKWKADESRSYGVLAHQLQEVLPQAVTGDKDAEEMQAVDYSKIVPLLVKSIQELKAEIELLKNK